MSREGTESPELSSHYSRHSPSPADKVDISARMKGEIYAQDLADSRLGGHDGRFDPDRPYGGTCIGI